MNIGDEVYIKSDGAKSMRWRIYDIQGDEAMLEWDFYRYSRLADDLVVINDDQRLFSELAEISRLTRTFIVVEKSGDVKMSNAKFGKSQYVDGWSLGYFADCVSTFRCPNCEDFEHQFIPSWYKGD